jgi:hypothetical protein
MLTYVSADAKKNLRSYFAIVIDPSKFMLRPMPMKKVNEDSRKALTNYFQHALTSAVSDAFPWLKSQAIDASSARCPGWN